MKVENISEHEHIEKVKIRLEGICQDTVFVSQEIQSLSVISSLAVMLISSSAELIMQMSDKENYAENLLKLFGRSFVTLSKIVDEKYSGDETVR